MEEFMIVATVISTIGSMITIIDKTIWGIQKIQQAHAEKSEPSADNR